MKGLIFVEKKIMDNSHIISSRKKRLVQITGNMVAAAVFSAFLISAVSCSNDPEEVRKMTQHDTMPQQQAEDVKMYYSEYGDVVFELFSPRIETYQNDNDRTVFPEGLTVVFYDSTGKTIESKITANYGIKLEKEKRMVVRGDVVVNNFEKNERLNTEELIWDQRQKRIYTDKFVTITTEEQVLYGEEGMESDETFNTWTIKKLKGQIEVEEE
jgi:LPS export ABC transporter protein LptC